MKHVYDVSCEVRFKDAKSHEGYWDSCDLSIVANGDIVRAARRAERIVLSRKAKPEHDRKTGRIFCYQPVRVRIVSIARVREVAS